MHNIKAHYDAVVIGDSYLSFIHSLILARSRSVFLLLDDSVQFGAVTSRNLGQLEVEVLKKIGERFNIDSLIKIERYLSEVNCLVSFDKLMIEFGADSYENVLELFRKVPSFIDLDVLNNLKNTDSDEFVQYMKNLFVNLSQITVEKGFDFNQLLAALTNADIKNLFEKFGNIIDRDNSSDSAHLLYIFQMVFENATSSKISKAQLYYLLCSLIGSKYVLDEQTLKSDLTFELNSLEVDILNCRVSDWEIFNSNLKSILLNSYYGMIDFSDLYYVGSLGEEHPFDLNNEKSVYKSISMVSDIDHELLNIYKNKRMVFSSKKLLGGSKAYWECFINENLQLSSTYSYQFSAGSKPEFFYDSACRDIYQSLVSFIPNLDYEEWKLSLKFSYASDQWVQFSSVSTQKLRVVDKDSNKAISNFHYWGPRLHSRYGLYQYFDDLCRAY